MKNAVIYARYSCEKQNEQSIEGQLRVCNEFAERNGYFIVHNYLDRAVSGKNDHRKEFQQMLKDSANHAFDYVIVYKLDRFARNRYDSAINKALLKKNGVRVLSACEQITDSPEGIILESMIEGYAEYYSAELAQKVKRGMRESCLKGNAAGIQPILGYTIINKKYAIVESEAMIVRKMFDDYNNGVTIKEIVEWLKNSGVRTHKGNIFSFGRVSDLLHNQKYIGKCKYGGEVYDNIVPPIIDEKVFYKAQERLSQNVHKAARAKATEKFILSGKLVCADCGSLMTGESGKSKTGEVYLYYKCSKKKKGTERCPSRAVKKDDIENSVYKAILSALNDDNFIAEVAEQAVEIHNKDLTESRELKLLKQQKSEVDRKLNNITEAICNGIFNTMTQTKMVELTNISNDLQVKIMEEESRVIEPLKKAKVIAFLKNYAKIVQCANRTESLESKKALFDLFIKEVIFDGERFLIVMKTTDEPDTDKTHKNDEKKETIRKKFELLRFGDPTALPLGIQNGVKPFAFVSNNIILPYSSTKIECLDKKQTLWAFFVLRSVVARTELRVG